jgi:hypothetical protein
MPHTMAVSLEDEKISVSSGSDGGDNDFDSGETRPYQLKDFYSHAAETKADFGMRAEKAWRLQFDIGGVRSYTLEDHRQHTYKQSLCAGGCVRAEALITATPQVIMDALIDLDVRKHFAPYLVESKVIQQVGFTLHVVYHRVEHGGQVCVAAPPAAACAACLQ